MTFSLRSGTAPLNLLAVVVLSTVCTLPPACYAQDTPDSSPNQAAPPPSDAAPASHSAPQGPIPPLPSTMPEQVVRNPNALCVQPPPGVTWRDYNGPFAKTVAIFAQRLERHSVSPTSASSTRYKPGTLLCTLTVKAKFNLFIRDSVDPVTFVSGAYNALISQAENGEPAYGQGFEGYGKRFGANLAGSSSSAFFKDFFYPTLFAQDPRYYRLGHGTVRRRVLHALEHSVVTHNVYGGHTFNAIEWFGDISTRVLSNTYLPNNRRGVAPVMESVGFDVVNDAGYDVLREFWPEIARKFKLPFRDRNEN